MHFLFHSVVGFEDLKQHTSRNFIKLQVYKNKTVQELIQPTGQSKHVFKAYFCSLMFTPEVSKHSKANEPQRSLPASVWSKLRRLASTRFKLAQISQNCHNYSKQCQRPLLAEETFGQNPSWPSHLTWVKIVRESKHLAYETHNKHYASQTARLEQSKPRHYKSMVCCCWCSGKTIDCALFDDIINFD